MKSDAWMRLSVRDVKEEPFGAKGDGVTEDHLSIQAAIDALSPVGGVVFLPAGTYLIGGTLKFNDKVFLRGAGIGATILKAKDALDQPILRNAGIDTRSANADLGLCDLTLDGNGDHQTDISGSPEDRPHGCFLKDCACVFIQRVHFKDCLVLGFAIRSTVEHRDAHTIFLSDCLGTGCGDTAFNFDFCKWVNVSNCVARSNGKIDTAASPGFGNGFWFKYCEDSQATGLLAHGNGEAGVDQAGDGIVIASCRYFVLGEWVSSENLRDGVRVAVALEEANKDSRDGAIGPGSAHRNGRDGVRLEGNQKNRHLVTRWTITGVNCVQNGERGFGFFQADNHQLNGCIAQSNGMGGSDQGGVRIEGSQHIYLSNTRAIRNNPNGLLALDASNGRAWGEVHLDSCFAISNRQHDLRTNQSSGTLYLRGGRIQKKKIGEGTMLSPRGVADVENFYSTIVNTWGEPGAPGKKYAGARPDVDKEGDAAGVAPVACRFRNLFIRTARAPGGDESVVVTLMRNGRAMRRFQAKIAGTKTAGNTEAGEGVNLRPGDSWSFRIESSAGAKSGSIQIACEMTARDQRSG